MPFVVVAAVAAAGEVVVVIVIVLVLVVFVLLFYFSCDLVLAGSRYLKSNVHTIFSSEMPRIFHEHIVFFFTHHRFGLALCAGPFPLGETASYLCARTYQTGAWFCPFSFSCRRLVILLFQHRAGSFTIAGPNQCRRGPLDEAVGHVQVTVLDGEEERRLPGLVSKVNLKANIEQELDHDQVAALCSPKKRCLTIQVNLFQIDSHGYALLCKFFAASASSRRDKEQKILSKSGMSP